MRNTLARLMPNLLFFAALMPHFSIFLPIPLTFFYEENMLFVSQATSFFGSRINESHAPRKTLDKDQILKTP
jgi:hypothetical protein